MARQVLPLSDSRIKKFGEKDKDYKVSDGRGLFLLVKKSGAKMWRFRYMFGGKEKLISLGLYPEISLKVARERREEYRRDVAMGLNPSAERKKVKIQKVLEKDFESVCLEWLKHVKSTHSLSYHQKLVRQFENNVFGYVGKIGIGELCKDDMVRVLKRVEDRGAVESMHRLFGLLDNVFKYALSYELCEINIMSRIDKKQTFAPSPVRHYAFITNADDLRAILLDIDGYRGSSNIRAALKLLPHLFVRPFNLRSAEWSEIDLKNKMWSISKEKMKMKQRHLVPLSASVVKIIEDLPRTSIYLFPSPASNKRCISNNTLNVALKRLGWSGDVIVPHGFRHTASTFLNERGHIHKIAGDVIEKQLAHGERNGVRAVYNHAQYLEERVRLMSWWSDFLDQLRDG
jgi:integrase